MVKFDLVSATVRHRGVVVSNVLCLQNIMALFLWLDLLLLLAGVRCTSVKNCHAGCHCEVESFGLFDSFSLTTVDCRGLGPGAIMPVPIPLDTAFLDLSSNAMGHLTDNMLAGPGYTTLVSLDLSSNRITMVSLSKNQHDSLRHKRWQPHDS